MSDLEFKLERTAKDLATLRLEGVFEGYAAVENVEKLIELVQSIDAPNILVDFGTIKYIDSAAVGVLIRMSQAAQSRGKTFGVIHINASIRKIFEVTHIDKIITIHGPQKG